MKHLSLKFFGIMLVLAAALPACSQTCQNKDDLAGPARTALENAAQQVFDQTAKGDANAMKASAVPSLQSNFNGIATAISDNKDAIKDAKPQLRNIYLIDTGATPPEDGTYYCGVFGGSGMSPSTAEFDLPGLQAGKYAVTIQDFIGNKGPYSITAIFQDLNGWKLAGYYFRPGAAVGHDGLWYLQQARDYKSKGQVHNAWFYYLTSYDLLAPITFMKTTMLNNIAKEFTSIQPKDVAAFGAPVTFTAGGKSYNITDMSIYPTDKSFDLSIRYSVPSTADFNGTQADARALANAMVAQYPELKNGFGNIWVHAVDGKGGDVVGLVKLK